MLRYYIKIAFRNIMKHKVQNLIDILGMSLGFTALVLGGYWYYWETHFDDFHPDSENIYQVTYSGHRLNTNGKSSESNHISGYDVEPLVQFLPEISAFCATVNTFNNYRISNEKINAAFYPIVTDTAFFKILRSDFIQGGYKNVPVNGEAVVLSRGMAERLFGTPYCEGETVQFKGQRPRKVIGIIENYPVNTDNGFDFVLLDRPGYTQYSQSSWSRFFVKFHPGADIDQVKKKLTQYKSHSEGWGNEDLWKFHLRTLPETYVNTQVPFDRFRNIRILALAGILIFVVSLINHFVLFMGYQQPRIRKNPAYISFGASVRSLTGKNLIELLIPLLLAFFISMSLLELIYPYYRAFVAVSRSGKTIDLIQLWTESSQYFIILLPLFVLLAAVPIVRLIKNTSTRTDVSRMESFPLLRRTLIVFQIFMGVLFFIITIALYKQVHYMNRMEMGLNTENVWQVDFGFPSRYDPIADMKEFQSTGIEKPMPAEELAVKFREIAGVEDITITVSPVIHEPSRPPGNVTTHIKVRGRDEMEEKIEGGDSSFECLDNFFSFWGIRLKAGELPVEIGKCVVNESGARKLGKDSLFARSDNRIVGVVHDYHYSGAQVPVNKLFFTYMSYWNKIQSPLRFIYVKINPHAETETVAKINTAIREYFNSNNDESWRVKKMDVLVQEINRPDAVIFAIFGLVALISLIITFSAINALVSLSAEQRQREMAIRKINGAVFRDILMLFTREYLGLVIIANLLAMPIGYLIMRWWYESYAYHTDLSLWIFIMVFVVTCLIVIFSIFWEIRKVIKVNPAEVIKAE